MDHELKQRLIGAVVVTALAAIFIPMLFDEPVDNRAKAVAELNVPPAPESQAQSANGADKLPASKEQVMAQNEPGLAVTEVEEDERNASQDAEDGANVKSPDANQATKNPVDSQGLQSKIAGLPANTGAETAAQETVPPEEEPDSSDEEGLSPEPVHQEKKATEKAEKPLKKAEIVKPEHESSKDANKTGEAVKKHGDKLSRWSLQAGSFSKRENAQAMVDKLRKQGFPASIVAKGNLYRIKIGPELDKAKAAQMKSKLAAQKIQSYLQAE
jgi:DedD protein